MDNFKENIETLKKYHPYVVIKSGGGGTLDSLSVEKTPSGCPTLKTSDGRFVYSQRDPLKSSERIADKFLGKDFDTFISIGFGLGYFLPAVMKILKKKHFLVVVEPRAELFFEAIKHRSFRELFSRKNTLIIIGAASKDDLGMFSNFVNPLRVKRIETFRHPVLYEIYKESYTRTEKKLKDSIDLIISNLMTYSRFGKRWITNIAGNIPYLFKKNLLPLNGLDFETKEVIVAGAGPSLDVALPHLKKINTPVAAADSALTSLLTEDVYPDIVLTIDPQPQCARFFNIDIPGKTLVCMSVISPVGIIKKTNRKGVLFRTNHPLERFLLGEPDAPLDTSGGSVVNILVDMFIRFKPKKIILTGVDFGYTGKRDHASGFTHSSDTINKFTTRECSIHREVTGTTHEDVEDYEGNRVRTSHALNRYRISLEEKIKNHTDISFIQTSMKGAKIEGTEYIPLDKIEFSDNGKNCVMFKDTPAEHSFTKKTVVRQIREGLRGFQEIVAIFTTDGGFYTLWEKVENAYPELSAILEYLLYSSILYGEKHCNNSDNVLKQRGVESCQFVIENLQNIERGIAG